MSETKKKYRTPEEKKKLINRLKRAKGQLEGICNMVENDIYCVDILTQSAAVSSAINAFNRELLENHINTCVTEGIKEGDEEKISELLAILKRLIK